MIVTLYTDPGCPFGFCAQRQELQLQWHYGHAIDLRLTMIVLSEQGGAYGTTGMTAEAVVRGRTRLAAEHGMPTHLGEPARKQATFPACRAYAGARTHAREQAYGLLRALRRRHHSEGELLDDTATLHGAAADTGIDAALVDAWLADPDVDADVRADMAAARAPLPEALAQHQRLSGPQDARRYSTSSAVFEHDGRRLVAAGFRPFAVYEVAMANVAPDAERRPEPADVPEVLAWAPFPLATAEVAALRHVGVDDARTELRAAGATFTPAAGDGYWTR